VKLSLLHTHQKQKRPN